MLRALIFPINLKLEKNKKIYSYGTNFGLNKLLLLTIFESQFK